MIKKSNSLFLSAAAGLCVVAAMAVISPTASGAATGQAFVKPFNTDAGDHFGCAVAISGDIMVVGSQSERSRASGVNSNPYDNGGDGNGAAYVFVRNNGTWTQQAYLKPSNMDNLDNFGYAVAVSGSRIVVGAPYERSIAIGVNGTQIDNSLLNAGAAYIFVRQGNTWVQEAYLKAANTSAEDQFGRSVAISGDTVVVGAHVESSHASGVNGDQGDDSLFYATGAAYVFVREIDTGAWSQQAYLKASNNDGCCVGEMRDIFGHSVGIFGDTIVIGAPGEDSSAVGVNGDQSNNDARQSGAAYVFVRKGPTWTQQAYLKASNTEGADQFGWSVAVFGDTVAVGAPFERSAAPGVNGNQADNTIGGAGAAYIFVRNGDQWSQQAYLKASNPGVQYYFGYDLDISADTVVVGSQNEGSGPTSGDGTNIITSAQSGAAYVFVRQGATWTQQSVLKEFTPHAGNEFGRVVAVSGDTVVVGTHQESSSTTGVNGIATNVGAPSSGATYVFTGVGMGPRLALASDGGSGHYVRFTGAPYSSYRLQRASALDGSWDDLVTLTAPGSGNVEYHDVSPLVGQAFYRTAQP
jgi:hypothetical protein